MKGDFFFSCIEALTSENSCQERLVHQQEGAVAAEMRIASLQGEVSRLAAEHKGANAGKHILLCIIMRAHTHTETKTHTDTHRETDRHARTHTHTHTHTHTGARDELAAAQRAESDTAAELVVVRGTADRRTQEIAELKAAHRESQELEAQATH